MGCQRFLQGKVLLPAGVSFPKPAQRCHLLVAGSCRIAKGLGLDQDPLQRREGVAVHFPQVIEQVGLFENDVSDGRQCRAIALHHLLLQ